MMRIRPLLAAIIFLAAIGYGLWRWQEGRQIAGHRQEAWEERQRIEATDRRLDTPIVLPRDQLSLDEFAQLITEQTGLAVAYDVDWQKTFSVYPLRGDTGKLPLEFSSRRMSLRAALVGLPDDLRVDLGDNQLTLRAADDTPSLAGELYTVIYPIPQPEWGSAEADAEAWADFVLTIPSYANAWDDVAGIGHLEAVPGALIVTQTRDVHATLRELLDNLQSMKSPPLSYEPVRLPDFLDAETKKTLAALSEPSRLDCVDLPLDELANFLAQQHEVPIVLNLKELEKAAVSPQTFITRKLEDVSFKSLLRLVLDELELTYLVERGTIQITTPDDAFDIDRMVLVAYPVHDLLGLERDYDPLVNLIMHTVAPNSWSEVGGPASLGGEPLNGWLFVSQASEVHDEIELLLAQLRQALAYDYPPARGMAAHHPDERIRTALETEVPLSFHQTRLSLIADEMAYRLKIPVMVRHKKLEEAAISIDTVFTAQSPAAPAWQQLELLLATQDMTYLVGDEVLQITTPDHAEWSEYLQVRVYDMRSLIDPDFGPLTAYDLINLIMATISLESWDEVGGRGTINEFRGVLVVGHTELVHRQIETLLRALERHCLPAVDVEQQPLVVDVAPNARGRQIEQRLATAVDIDFDADSLVDAVRRLAGDSTVIFHHELSAEFPFIPIPADERPQTMTAACALDLALRQFV